MRTQSDQKSDFLLAIKSRGGGESSEESSSVHCAASRSDHVITGWCGARVARTDQGQTFLRWHDVCDNDDATGDGKTTSEAIRPFMYYVVLYQSRGHLANTIAPYDMKG